MMKFSERSIGDVTILDCSGRITLGEGSSGFRDVVRKMMSRGKYNVLLNLGEVSYIDSSGFGELVSSFTLVSNCGGEFKLLNLNKRVRDLLQITKLYSVFEVFEDEAAAVRSFGPAAVRLRCRCPLCGFWCYPPLFESKCWQEQTCLSCDAAFTVGASETREAEALAVASMKFRSYYDEYYQIVCGAPFTIELHGRLDLFSTTALSNAWNAIPKPRRVLVDLRHAKGIQAGGRDALVDLLANLEEDGRAAVSLEGLDAPSAFDFPASPPFYRERAAALAALGDVSDTPRLIAMTGRI